MDAVTIPVEIIKTIIWATALVVAVLYIFRGGIPGSDDE